MRKAITFLQSASITGEVTTGLLREISGCPNPDQVKDFFDRCVAHRPWPEIEASTIDLVLSGYDLSQVLEMLCEIIVKSTEIREELKAKILLKISAADGMITNRADPQLQFMAIAAALSAE